MTDPVSGTSDVFIVTAGALMGSLRGHGERLGVRWWGAALKSRNGGGGSRQGPPPRGGRQRSLGPLSIMEAGDTGDLRAAVKGTEPEGGKGLPERRPGKQLNNQLE